MKRLVISMLVICSGLALQAQHEVGLSLGTSHLLGDFGGGPGQGTIFLKDLDLPSTRPSAGLFYRYNFARFLAVRGQFMYAGLASNDLYSQEPSRFNRGLASKASALDLSVQLEFNFIPINFCCGKVKFTPFIAAGAAITQVNATVFGGGIEGIAASELQYITQGGGPAFNIPFTAGFKFKTKKRIVVGVEASYRLAFTDKLDGYVRQQNDQFFLVNAQVSYVFCKGGGAGKMSKEMRCPTYN